MSRIVRLAFASIILFAPAAYAQGQTTDTPAPGSRAPATQGPATVTTEQATAMTAEQFVANAGASNMFEIQSSQLALESAGNERVRAFAEQMVADHTAAGERLQALLAESGSRIALPRQLDARHQSMLDQLAASTGEAFDAAYLSLQLQAHEEAVALFTAYAEAGGDETLRAFAASTLPVLQHHLSQVEALTGRT